MLAMQDLFYASGTYSSHLKILEVDWLQHSAATADEQKSLQFIIKSAALFWVQGN